MKIKKYLLFAAFAFGCSSRLEFITQENGIKVPAPRNLTYSTCYIRNSFVECIAIYDRNSDGKGDLIKAELKKPKNKDVSKNIIYADNDLDGILDAVYIDYKDKHGNSKADNFYDEQKSIKELYPNLTEKELEVETFAKSGLRNEQL